MFERHETGKKQMGDEPGPPPIPQVIPPEELLELVWGLEPQTCSLRVRIGPGLLKWLKSRIVGQPAQAQWDTQFGNSERSDVKSEIVRHGIGKNAKEG